MPVSLFSKSMYIFLVLLFLISENSSVYSHSSPPIDDVLRVASISSDFVQGILDGLGLTDPAKRNRMKQKESYINELNEKIRTGLNLKDKLENIRKEVFQMKQRYVSLQEQLGKHAETDVLRANYEYLATNCSLFIEKIELLPEVKKELYVEVSAVCKLQGVFKDIRVFLNTIAKEKQILNVSDLVITGKPKLGQGSAVECECIISSFYSLDSDNKGYSMIPLFPFNMYWAYMTEAEMDETIKQKEQTVKELQLIIDQVQKYTNDINDLRKKISVLEALKNNQAGQMLLLDEVYRHIPEKIWLTKIQSAMNKITHVGNKVTLVGYSTSQTAIGDFMGSLDASSNINNVNLLIVKLTEIEGVETYHFELNFTFIVSNQEDNNR
ncbi:type 4a pilus biogenesis protein PilO [bacterium]|nr:type 4a pilus biogenesis protein PilO [candidate division CSSED10-310 bacterium]